MIDLKKAVGPEIKYFLITHLFLFNNQELKNIVNGNIDITEKDREKISNLVNHIQERCEHKEHLNVIIKRARNIFSKKKILQCRDCGKKIEN